MWYKRETWYIYSSKPALSKYNVSHATSKMADPKNQDVCPKMFFFSLRTQNAFILSPINVLKLNMKLSIPDIVGIFERSSHLPAPLYWNELWGLLVLYIQITSALHLIIKLTWEWEKMHAIFKSKCIYFCKSIKQCLLLFIQIKIGCSTLQCYAVSADCFNECNASRV